MKAVIWALIAGLTVPGSLSAQDAPKAAPDTPLSPQTMPQPSLPPAPDANSQKNSAPAASGRFTFVPADGGYLRLDSMTGQVSLCSAGTVGWACQLVPDERAALDAEIARLQDQVGRLKADASKPEPPRPRADVAPRPGDDQSRVRLPTREEMEKAKAAFERAWRHFTDMVYDFQKDVTGKE